MIVTSLRDNLLKRGISAEIAWLPFRSYSPEVASQTVGIRLLDVREACGDKIDTLITIRYPAYALKHPNKRCWFIHHHRQAYDLWGSPYQDMEDTPDANRIRRMMFASDELYLREARRVYTNSRIVASRLVKFNAIEPDGVLYPPHPNPEIFRSGDFGDFFLYAARLCPIKRQSLAIEAMRHVKSPFKLVFVGSPDAPGYGDELLSLAKNVGVADRVEFLGWLSEEEKAEYTAAACAALYIPFDEDSYGYSTLEAFHSSKPVITLTDSGGPLEVIDDGRNGCIADPTPEALAEAMETVWQHKARAKTMGREALETISLLGIDWNHVVESLVA